MCCISSSCYETLLLLLLHSSLPSLQRHRDLRERDPLQDFVQSGGLLRSSNCQGEREGGDAGRQSGKRHISSSVKVRDHCIIALPRINFRQHNVCCNALVVLVVPAIVNKEALFFGIILACIKGSLLLPCINFRHFPY